MAVILKFIGYQVSLRFEKIMVEPKKIENIVTVGPDIHRGIPGPPYDDIPAAPTPNIFTVYYARL